jgi:nitrite reductase (NADH) small subunit
MNDDMNMEASWIGRDLPPIYRNGVEHFLLSHEGLLYLIPNRCPHRGGPLKYGFLNAQGELVCPMHGNTFAIRSLIRRAGVIRLLENQDAEP